MKHLSLCELLLRRALGLLELIEVLARLDLGAAGLRVVQKFSVSDLVASSCPTRQLRLHPALDLTSLVLRNSHLHEVCGHPDHTLFRFGAKICRMACLCGLSGSVCGSLMLNMQLVAGAVCAHRSSSSSWTIG